MLHLRLHAPAPPLDLGDDGVLGGLDVPLDLRLPAGGQPGSGLERLPLFDRHRVARQLHHHRDGALRVGERGEELAVDSVQRDLLELQPGVGGRRLVLGGSGDGGDRGGGECRGGEQR